MGKSYSDQIDKMLSSINQNLSSTTNRITCPICGAKGYKGYINSKAHKKTKTHQNAMNALEEQMFQQEEPEEKKEEPEKEEYISVKIKFWQKLKRRNAYRSNVIIMRSDGIFIRMNLMKDEIYTFLKKQFPLQENVFYFTEDGEKFDQDIIDKLLNSNDLFKAAYDAINQSDGVTAIQGVDFTDVTPGSDEYDLAEEIYQRDIEVMHAYSKYNITPLNDSDSFEDIFKNIGNDIEGYKPNQCGTLIANICIKPHIKMRTTDIFGEEVFEFDRFQEGMTMHQFYDTYSKPLGITTYFVDKELNPLKIFGVDNKRNTKKTNTSSLVLMCYNNHFESLDINKNKLTEKLNKKLKEENEKVYTPNANYPLNTYQLNLMTEPPTVIESIDAIVPLMSEEGTHRVYAKSTDDMNQILLDCVKGSYLPKIKMNGNKLKSIDLRVNDTKSNITIIDKNATRTKEDVILTSEQMHEYDTLDKKWKASIFNNEYKSFYNEETLNNLQYDYHFPMTCKFTEEDYEKVYAIDINKHYSDILANKITDIPIFHSCDRWEPFDGTIKDNTWYKVLYYGQYNPVMREKFPPPVIGKILKHFNKYHVQYQLTPSEIKPNPLKDVIHEVYDSKILVDSQPKDLNNQNIGFLGKMYNKYSEASVFTKLNEAWEFIWRKGWKTAPLALKDDDLTLYIARKNHKTKLENGFLFLHRMIYMQSAWELYLKHKEIYENQGLELLGLKTDCLIYAEKPIIEESTAIGGWKYEDDVCLPNKLYNPVERIEKDDKIFRIFPEQKPVNKIYIDDEYNYDATLLKKYKWLAITAKFPGSGKTVMAIKMALEIATKEEMIVISRNGTNLGKFLDQGIKAVTLHKLLNMDIKKEQKNFGHAINLKKYKVVIFEEAFQSELYMLDLIYPKLKEVEYLIMNGDLCQTTPIDPNLTVNKSIYRKFMNMMFPNQIELKENKTLEGKDKQTLETIHEQLFDEDCMPKNVNIKEIAYEHFDSYKTLDDIIKAYPEKEMKFVTYTNRSADNILSRVVARSYKKGDELVLREYASNKDLVINNKYKIERIKRPRGEMYFTLSCNGKPVNVTATTHVRKIKAAKRKKENPTVPIHKFRLANSATTHSLQGDRLDNNELLVLCDLDHIHIDNEWFWTGITRSRNFDDVVILENIPYIARCTNKKLRGYIQQDINAERQPDYTLTCKDVNRKLDKQKGRCAHCTKALDKWILNRINNRLSHTDKNTNILCPNCNCADHYRNK